MSMLIWKQNEHILVNLTRSVWNTATHLSVFLINCLVLDLEEAYVTSSVAIVSQTTSVYLILATETFNVVLKYYIKKMYRYENHTHGPKSAVCLLVWFSKITLNLRASLFYPSESFWSWWLHTFPKKLFTKYLLTNFDDAEASNCWWVGCLLGVEISCIYCCVLLVLYGVIEV